MELAQEQTMMLKMKNQQKKSKRKLPKGRKRDKNI